MWSEALMGRLRLALIEPRLRDPEGSLDLQHRKRIQSTNGGGQINHLMSWDRNGKRLRDLNHRDLLFLPPRGPDKLLVGRIGAILIHRPDQIVPWGVPDNFPSDSTKGKYSGSRERRVSGKTHSPRESREGARLKACKKVPSELRNVEVDVVQAGHMVIMTGQMGDEGAGHEPTVPSVLLLLARDEGDSEL